MTVPQGRSDDAPRLLAVQVADPVGGLSLADAGTLLDDLHALVKVAELITALDGQRSRTTGYLTWLAQDIREADARGPRQPEMFRDGTAGGPSATAADRAARYQSERQNRWTPIRDVLQRQVENTWQVVSAPTRHIPVRSLRYESPLEAVVEILPALGVTGGVAGVVATLFALVKQLPEVHTKYVKASADAERERLRKEAYAVLRQRLRDAPTQALHDAGVQEILRSEGLPPIPVEQVTGPVDQPIQRAAAALVQVSKIDRA